MILFLQTWRASIIPLIAVPVSVVGTFAALYLLGFSINTLTLFGLVLAIGIVVDDAIVVVENVERNIEEGRTPLEAAHQAMKEVSGPDRRDRARAVRGVRADGVPDRRHRPVLQAVRRDDRDLDGDLGDQFADLVAGARRQTAPFARRAEGCAFARGSTALFGWLFRSVQSFLQGKLRQAITAAVARILKRRGRVFAVYALLLLGTGLMFNAVPRGFIPTQDKLYLIAGVKLPEGASLERTDAVLKKVVEIAKSIEGVAHVAGDDRLESAAVHQHAELRRRLPHPEAVQRAPPQREGNQRRDQAKDRRHQGRYGLRPDAAADSRARQRLPATRCSSRTAPVLATARCRTPSARCKAR